MGRGGRLKFIWKIWNVICQSFHCWKLCCISNGSLKNPVDSYRQYVGVVIGGENFIYINAVNKNSGEEFERRLESLKNFSKHTFGVCDGGSSYWGVLYNPKTRTFKDLAFNGSAWFACQFLAFYCDKHAVSHSPILVFYKFTHPQRLPYLVVSSLLHCATSAWQSVARVPPYNFERLCRVRIQPFAVVKYYFASHFHGWCLSG